MKLIENLNHIINEAQGLEELIKNYYELFYEQEKIKSKREKLTSENSKAGLNSKEGKISFSDKDKVLIKNKNKIEKFNKEIKEKQTELNKLKTDIFKLSKDQKYPGNLFNQDISTLSNKLFIYFKNNGFVLFDIKVNDNITAQAYRLPNNNAIKEPSKKELLNIFPKVENINIKVAPQDKLIICKLNFLLK